VRLLKKQDANSKPKQNHGGTEQVWKQIRVFRKYGAAKGFGPLNLRPGENAAKKSADDSPVK
jgi:hypothetical protein